MITRAPRTWSILLAISNEPPWSDTTRRVKVSPNPVEPQPEVPVA